MVSKQTFIDRIKKEFPDAIENQTKSYISFQHQSYSFYNNVRIKNYIFHI